ncbi:MAG: hypothetical protein P8168_06385, partial [Deltaproteobacteria bacterium]
LCLLHSENPNKDIKKFDKKIIQKLKDEDFDFTAVYFPAQIEFPIDYQFTKETSFSSTTFINNANFFRSIFVEKANFDEVLFNEKAIFISVRFLKGADFSSTIFLKEARFFLASLSGEVIFFDTDFQDKANFYGVILTENAKVFFGNIFTIKNSYKQKFHADFSRLEIHPTALLQFENICLSNVIFEHTDLRKINFYNVTWHRLWWRDALYDEFIINEKENLRISSIIKQTSYIADVLPNLIANDLPERLGSDDYAAVEELYRQLKINYENEGDFKRVGDFHYGEKEMHRKASKWRRFPFYWYNLYRWLSGYGERPSWALGWLALFLVGIAALIWWLGLEVGHTTHLADFGDSFIYVLQKATIQRPTWAEPVGFWGKMVAGFSVLIIPGQTALFLLALRNRLGRRR